MAGDGKDAGRRRPWRLLGLAGLTLLLLLAGFAFWLLATNPGARWLLARAPVPETVSMGPAGGSLAHGLVLQDLVYDDGRVQLRSPRLEVLLRPDWAARGLRIRTLLIDALTVQIGPGEESTASEPLDVVLARVASPVPILLEEGRVNGISVTIAGRDEPLRFDELSLAARWGDALRGIDATLRGAWLEAALQGELALAAGRTDLDLQARVDGTRWSGALPRDLRLQAGTADEMKAVTLALSSAQAGLEAEGTLETPLENPSLLLTLALERWSVPAGDSGMLALRDVGGAVSYRDGEGSLDLEGGATWADQPPVRWNAKGSVDEARLALERLEATLEPAVQGDSSPPRVVASGTVTWGEPARVELALDWDRLQWPLVGSAPQLTSDTGSGRLDGTLDAWRFDGGFELDTPDYPGGRVALAATGDTRRARFERLELQALGGRLEAQGEVDWSGELRGSGEGRFEDLDLEALLPDWPAVISGELALAGVLGDAPGVDLQLRRLGGSLFGEALAGSGRVVLEGATGDSGAVELERLLLEPLELALGPSRVTAKGALNGSTLNLDLDLDVQRPGWAADRLGGEARGRLVVDSAAAFPLLEADLVAEDLSPWGLKIDHIEVERPASGEPRVIWRAEGLSQGDQRIDHLGGMLAAAPGRGADAYRLSLDGEAGEFRFHGAMAGRLDLGTPLGESRWSGELLALTLAQGERGVLSLADPAPLSLAAREYAVNGACLDTRRDGRLCVDLAGAPGERLDLSLDLQELPLSLLRLLVPHELRTTQRLNGTANWEWRRDANPSGAAAIVITPGEVGLSGDEDGRVATGQGFLGFQLSEGNLEGGRIDLPLADAGHLRANFTIGGVRLDGTGRLDGALDLDLRNLALLDSFVGQLDDFGGVLSSRIDLGGTVSRPVFEGRLDLTDGRFRVPALGTSVRELTLAGRVNGADRLDLEGRFLSGTGEGRLTLGVDFARLDDPRVQLRLQGESLALARLPDLDADLSPNLSLRFAGGAWQLSGALAIPRALVAPLTSFVSRVDVSPDVEVVAGELSPVPESANAEPVSLFGDVALTLGRDVRLEMDLASLALGGGVRLTWDGELAPLATGAVTVNGTVSAWGPRLTITDGRVRWDEAPVTNPALEIRAQRDVFGNTLVRTAGVRVSGTARRPDIEAFTQPLTTSERAWAVLVTGSDVNYAQGVGAVDVGTYIAPRIFLSYGISLFDSDNVVGLRYDLKRGWGIKATSGQRESGVDLSYTIETGQREKGDGESADDGTVDRN